MSSLIMNRARGGVAGGPVTMSSGARLGRDVWVSLPSSGASRTNASGSE
jgi:hypothetical protein